MTLAQFTSIEAAVADALQDYAESHALDALGRRGAERDFRLFYAKAILGGARGIRWNWGGCILCPDNLEPGPRAMTRILLAEPVILHATGGRALGTHVCRPHERSIKYGNASPQELAKAGLRRIARDPPRELAPP
jgi:hypothetical protein